MGISCKIRRKKFFTTIKMFKTLKGIKI